MAKQICQAVAYLHNLKPPIVHRDVKPANVLVANSTHVTKLCDMGLSKLKSAGTLTHQTTSTTPPGTPAYMAPECLLQRKKATIAMQSDVWSLASTLIELFTEKDCWDRLEDENAGEEDNKLDRLMDAMKRKETPRSLEALPSTINTSLQQILRDCFHYDIGKRPHAIDIVNEF